jgi:hypothetical protein
MKTPGIEWSVGKTARASMPNTATTSMRKTKTATFRASPQLKFTDTPHLDAHARRGICVCVCVCVRVCVCSERVRVALAGGEVRVEDDYLSLQFSEIKGDGMNGVCVS